MSHFLLGHVSEIFFDILRSSRIKRYKKVTNIPEGRISLEFIGLQELLVLRSKQVGSGSVKASLNQG